MGEQRSHTFFGLKMPIEQAKKHLEGKRQELLRLEETAIRGVNLDHVAIAELKARCEHLFGEIKKAEKKIKEGGLA